VIEMGEGSRWHTPFWIQTKATVVGGLIVVVVVGAAGLLIARLSDLSAGEVLLYVGLPAFALAVLAGTGIALRKAWRAVSDARIWQAAVTDTVLETQRQLHWHVHGDVIHEARVLGWTVESDREGLKFPSPDGDDGFVGVGNMDPYSAAEYLNNLDPHDFPEKWYPSQLRGLIDTEKKVIELERKLDEEIERLGKTIRLLNKRPTHLE
jgi:hypothetical protein